MGNKHPSEYHGVHCGICGVSLPPCKSFDCFKKETIDRTVDKIDVYNYLGGRYYRQVGGPYYYCPNCFWRPKNDYIQKQEEERKRRKEQRRREEQARRERQRREEEERQRQRQREEELRHREQEAKEEAARQEALQIERERKEEERRKRAEEQDKFEDEAAQKKGLAEKFASWVLNKDKEKVQKQVQVQPYHNSMALAAEDNLETQKKNDTAEEYELWSEEIINDDNPEPVEVIDEIDITNKVVSMVSDLQPPDDYIDVPWLKIVQTQLLNHYAKVNGLSEMETEILLYVLSTIRYKLSDAEYLNLTRMLCSLSNSYPLEYQHTSTTFDYDLPGQFLVMLLNSGYELNIAKTECMRQCLIALIANCIEDTQLQAMVIEATSKFWSPYDRFLLFKRFNEMSFSFSEQKHIMHLIQAYDILPTDVQDILKTNSSSSGVIKSLLDNAEREPDVHLTDLIEEIQATKLVEPATLEHVNGVVSKVKKILNSFTIHLDFKQHLNQAALDKAKSDLRTCAIGTDVDSDKLASALVTLCCAVKESQGYCPRTAQLVALTLMIISNAKSTSRLLEVMTGEGKSTVIAMFAAVLAFGDKHVDVITSSPILACRDVEDWQSFFDILDLKVTHNTKIREGLVRDPDNERRNCYKHPIVYGTVSNFAADILREEFEQKDVRSGRRFDAVIADEVDLLMLDEGVQFTYLSHRSAVLHHMEPILATVWAVIGQYSRVATNYGEVLHAGIPKLFSDTIFESINAEECQVDESSQFLIVAQQAGLIDEVTVGMLMSDNQQIQQGSEEKIDLKKDAMSTIGKDTIIAVMIKLEEYLPHTFEAYAINEDGLLQLISHEPTSKAATKSDHRTEEKLPVVKILVLENGLACTLCSQDELKDGATAKIEASLHFSDEPDTEQDREKAEVKLPIFLREFVTNQLPTYVDSALRSMEMVENREYAISTEGKIIPVDFLNSGVMQMNKKWGGGLQQMLEMKHNLSLSSMSVVTNFMSHVELFSRYKENGVIFGLSGTLDIDSPSTAKVLFDLFKVQSCLIPTHKRRKLYEKPASIVEGGKAEWFKKIMDAINDAVKPEAWKRGRAVLVLCEDIKTAVDLNAYVTGEVGYDTSKVHLYARSNSKELQSIQHKFDPGEIAIATNLASRGTDIKLTNEVKRSGGLLCLITFLTRNRRVELQSFGRSARKGEPGSVQCILKAASLPLHYQGLDLTTIRKLRAEREKLRLDQLLNSDVKEVKLREILFKKHCEYLKRVNAGIDHREDKSITLDSINESWGQWLQMKSGQITRLKEEKLSSELTQAHSSWPIVNFYHKIKFGNRLLIEAEEENAKSAYQHYSSSIKLEPRYAAIAYYNRAYATIIMSEDGYMDRAIEDLTEAEKCLDPYINEVSTVLQCVSMVKRAKEPPPKDSDSGEEVDKFSAQMQLRIQIFGFVRDKIREATAKIRKFKEEGDNIEAEALGVFSLIPDADFVTSQELYTMWNLGMEVVFSVKKKPRFCWEGLVVLLIGIAEIVAGVALAVFTVGAAANFGMGLITEGVSDCIDGVVAMATGEFSWKEWGISKAVSIAVSLISGGVARFATKGVKAMKMATKLGKELKAIPKVAKNSWGLASKANFKNVVKYVGKTVAEEALVRGIAYGQDEGLKVIVEKIGEACKKSLQDDLHQTFTSGNLGRVVDSYFVHQLPEAYVRDDKMSPVIRKKAHDFFSNIGNEAVETLVADTYIKKHLTNASLSLLTQLSSKHKGGKLVYKALEAAEILAIVDKAITDFDDLLERFIPEAERVCEEFAREEPPLQPAMAITSYSHLTCSATLKEELVDVVGDIFSDAVSIFLEQNLGSVVNHGLNVTVNHAGRKAFKKFMKTEQTIEAVKAGQKANFIRSVDPFESSHQMPAVANYMVGHYTSKIAGTDKAGSALELKIAAEHYGQGVTIFQEKNGRFVRDCSIDPSTSQKTGANIELLYTAPSNGKAIGHYDVIVKGKAVRIQSDNSNCLFQAFAGGRNPHLTSSKQGQRELKTQALEVRQTVAASINKNPQLWAEHISHRLELTQLRNGNRFALLGAGPKNKRTRVYSDMYKEMMNKDELVTMYRQGNGIKCTATRRYAKRLKSDDNGNLVSEDGSRLTRMTSMEVHMDGLSFQKNEGRCWTTLPVTGMVKRSGGKAVDSAVSFHLCPSEAGANAGNQYANAVMASPYFNKSERHLWTRAIKTMIGEGDFSMSVTVKTESLIPERARNNFSDFFQGLNKERKAQGRQPIHKTNEAALKKRFQAMQELDNRACRTKKYEAVITNDKNQSVTIRMNRDVDLYVPSSFTQEKQSYQIPGEDLTKSHAKIGEQKFDQPPKYRQPLPSASAADILAFDQDVKEKFKHNSHN